MIPFCLEVLFQAGNCFCPTQVNFPALIPAVVLPCYMSPEQIVTVTAAISILMAFLQPVHPSLTRAQTLQEQRISSLDKVITGTKAILQACGHPQYLDSLHDLWHQASQALFLLEHMLWPNQPPETPLYLVLPRESRPLSDLMLDSFDEFHDTVLNAIPEVQQLQEWFAEQYDVGVHNAFNNMLTDSLLLFRTAEALIRVKLRFRNRPLNQNTNPIDLDEDPQPANPSTPSAGDDVAMMPLVFSL